MFLMGPLKQLSKMFEKGRIFATIIYLAALVLTLWAALKVRLTLIHMLVTEGRNPIQQLSSVQRPMLLPA